MTRSTYDPKEHDKFIKHVSTCTTKTPKNALAYLETKVVAYLTKKVGDSGGADKKLFEKSHNLVTSYIDGMKSGDVEVKDLKGLHRELLGAKSVHDKALAEAEARKAAKAAKEGATTEDAATGGDPNWKAPDWLKEYRKGKEMHDPGEGVEDTFKKYAKFKKDVPRSIGTKPYMAIRVPILIVPNGIPDVFKLQKTGLCDDMLFGYPVLKDQVLIGLNHSWLKDNFGLKTKISVRQDGEKDEKLDYVAAANRVIKEIKERTGRSYTLMEGIHGFDSHDVYWAWVANDADLRRLNGTTGTATFSVQNWTLPFPDQVRKMKPRSR